MKALGLTLADFESDVLDIWPDNVLSIAVFKSLRTQWRQGSNGPTGLDYSAIDPVFRHLQVAPDAQSQIFADLQLMEVAALNEIRKHG